MTVPGVAEGRGRGRALRDKGRGFAVAAQIFPLRKGALSAAPLRPVSVELREGRAAKGAPCTSTKSVAVSQGKIRNLCTGSVGHWHQKGSTVFGWRW